MLPIFFTGCGSKPTIDLPASVTTIGQATPISFHVQDKHGLTKVSVWFEQNGGQYPAVQQITGPDRDSAIKLTIGTKTTPRLKDGKAKLVIEATSAGFGHGTTRVERDVNVVTQAPTVSVDSDQHYLYKGMADLATLNVTGAYSAAGVRVGDQSFRAWPMPGGKPGLFSL